MPKPLARLITKERGKVLASLRSFKCAACGLSKRPQHPFCLSCYEKLPYTERQGLRDPMRIGYEKKFMGFLKYLKVEKPYWSEVD